MRPTRKSSCSSASRSALEAPCWLLLLGAAGAAAAAAEGAALAALEDAPEEHEYDQVPGDTHVAHGHKRVHEPAPTAVHVRVCVPAPLVLPEALALLSAPVAILGTRKNWPSVAGACCSSWARSG